MKRQLFYLLILALLATTLTSVRAGCFGLGKTQQHTSHAKIKGEKQVVFDRLFNENAKPTDFSRTLTLLEEYQHLAGPQQVKFVNHWLEVCKTPTTNEHCNDFGRYVLDTIHLNNPNVTRFIKPLVEHCGLNQFKYCKPYLIESLGKRVSKVTQNGREYLALIDRNFIEPLGLSIGEKSQLNVTKEIILKGLDSITKQNPNLIDSTFEGLPVGNPNLLRPKGILAVARICKPIVSLFGSIFSQIKKTLRCVPSVVAEFDEFFADWLSKYELCNEIVKYKENIDRLEDESREETFIPRYMSSHESSNHVQSASSFASARTAAFGS